MLEEETRRGGHCVRAYVNFGKKIKKRPLIHSRGRQKTSKQNNYPCASSACGTGAFIMDSLWSSLPPAPCPPSPRPCVSAADTQFGLLGLPQDTAHARFQGINTGGCLALSGVNSRCPDVQGIATQGSGCWAPASLARVRGRGWHPAARSHPQ